MAATAEAALQDAIEASGSRLISRNPFNVRKALDE